MNAKGVLIILVVIAVMVILFVVIGNSGKVGVGDEDNIAADEGSEAGAGSETFDPAVPDENLEVTKPKTESKAAPGSEASRRVFEMIATKDGYDPERIVANQGDTVHIDLKTAGVGYDIALPDIGLYQSVKEGEEKLLEFQALTPGTFTYLCQDMCPHGKEIKGSLVVKEK